GPRTPPVPGGLPPGVLPPAGPLAHPQPGGPAGQRPVGPGAPGAWVYLSSRRNTYFYQKSSSNHIFSKGRVQDGQRAEERGQQEVCLQRRSAAHFPQTVPTSRRQLRIKHPWLFLFCVQICCCFFIRLIVSYCESHCFNGNVFD
uniref:Uncharacterized protein n=1 Tax=Gasterosteus aculeatus TaxID=69293 RepID=G3Q3X4_GASAC